LSEKEMIKSYASLEAIF